MTRRPPSPAPTRTRPRTAGRVAVLACTPLLVAGVLTAATDPASAAPARAATTRPAAGGLAPRAGTDTGTATTGTTGTTGTSGTAAVQGPRSPQGPTGPRGPAGAASSTVTVDLGGITGKPSQSVVVLLLLTVLSVAPALLLLCTGFTKIVVVLSLTRNALGLQNVPPNQVLAGLAFFLSLVVMGPVLSAVNTQGVQPWLHGTKTQSQAWADGTAPLRTWMTRQTRRSDIAMVTSLAKAPAPANASDVPLTTLVPAFVLSELRAAFIIGFAVFVPFLVVDLVVSSSLMSLGMMMVPPVLVSLPFKLLLFVMVDGWALVSSALVGSYR